MHTLVELQKVIEVKLKEKKCKETPSELYQPIVYALEAGGKRIRPALCLMICQLFAEDYSNALPAALALEIFHNFTLLHDDIMDKAEMRRNKLTVHKKWDENTAILSGDAMMILAYSYLEDLPDEIQTRIFILFNKTALEVCEGQQYDINFEHRETVNIDEYLEMIRLKTAVLIAACLQIGAICGGSNNQEAELMYNLGIHMGLAFQLQDDYLDSFGDPVIFGKKNGGDIIANKKTFLLIKALELAKGDDLNELTYWLQETNSKADEKIKSVIEIYRNLCLDQILRKKIDDYYIKCKDVLKKLNIEENKLISLHHFIDKLAARNL